MLSPEAFSSEIEDSWRPPPGDFGFSFAFWAAASAAAAAAASAACFAASAAFPVMGGLGIGRRAKSEGLLTAYGIIHIRMKKLSGRVVLLRCIRPDIKRMRTHKVGFYSQVPSPQVRPCKKAALAANASSSSIFSCSSSCFHSAGSTHWLT